jgi:hypothetical protein
VDRRGLGRRADGDTKVDVTQVAGRSGELELARIVPQRLRGVQELSAGRIPAGAAVVVRWVPVGQPDEQHGIDGFGDVGVSKPDRLSAFLTPRPQPARKVRKRDVVVDDDGFDERCLPWRNSCPPDLGAVMAVAAMSLATWRTVSARRSS